VNASFLQKKLSALGGASESRAVRRLYSVAFPGLQAGINCVFILYPSILLVNCYFNILLQQQNMSIFQHIFTAGVYLHATEAGCSIYIIHPILIAKPNNNNNYIKKPLTAGVLYDILIIPQKGLFFMRFYDLAFHRHKTGRIKWYCNLWQ